MAPQAAPRLYDHQTRDVQIPRRLGAKARGPETSGHIGHTLMSDFSPAGPTAPNCLKVDKVTTWGDFTAEATPALKTV